MTCMFYLGSVILYSIKKNSAFMQDICVALKLSDAPILLTAVEDLSTIYSFLLTVRTHEEERHISPLGSLND